MKRSATLFEQLLFVAVARSWEALTAAATRDPRRPGFLLLTEDEKSAYYDGLDVFAEASAIGLDDVPILQALRTQRERDRLGEPMRGGRP